MSTHMETLEFMDSINRATRAATKAPTPATAEEQLGRAHILDAHAALNAIGAPHGGSPAERIAALGAIRTDVAADVSARAIVLYEVSASTDDPTILRRILPLLLPLAPGASPTREWLAAQTALIEAGILARALAKGEGAPDGCEVEVSVGRLVELLAVAQVVDTAPTPKAADTAPQSLRDALVTATGRDWTLSLGAYGYRAGRYSVTVPHGLWRFEDASNPLSAVDYEDRPGASRDDVYQRIAADVAGRIRAHETPDLAALLHKHVGGEWRRTKSGGYAWGPHVLIGAGDVWLLETFGMPPALLVSTGRSTPTDVARWAAQIINSL